MESCFLRDTSKREVDFVVLRDGAPLFAVELRFIEKQDTESEERLVSVAIGGPLQDLDLVIQALQGTRRDRMVVPGQDGRPTPLDTRRGKERHGQIRTNDDLRGTAMIRRLFQKGASLLFWPLLVMLTLLGLQSLSTGAALLETWFHEPLGWLPFTLGAAAYAALWKWYWRGSSSYGFVTTLDHELVHVLAAWLTGSRVDNLNATALGGGKVNIQGSNGIISMAPYLMSIGLLLAMLLTAIASSTVLPLLRPMLGVAWAYHCFKVFDQARPRQTDFRWTTWPLAVPVVIASGLLTTGMVLALHHGGGGAMLTFLEDTWNALLDHVIALVGLFRFH